MDLKNPKDFYRTYKADDTLSILSEKVCELISHERAVHAFEFGHGTGKHLRRLRAKGIEPFGIDISILNCIRSMQDIERVALADETLLRHLVNFDCVFSVSVLDHIEDVDGIIGEFKRICNKSVFLAETNDTPGEFYYPHAYESYNFVRLPFEWYSEGDGATYYIWKWTKGSDSGVIEPDDDLA